MDNNFALFVWAVLASSGALVSILGWVDCASEKAADEWVAGSYRDAHEREIGRSDILRREIEMLKRALRSRRATPRATSARGGKNG